MAAHKDEKQVKHAGVHFVEDNKEEIGHEDLHGHVHFDNSLHDSVVTVMQDKDGNYLVKVGFLKIGHKYEITVTLPTVLDWLNSDTCMATKTEYLQLKGIRSSTEGHVLCCLYTAHKEGVLCEDVVISNNKDDEVCVKVSLHARVMGRLQGTPMLLDGVRCVGVMAEYDSEQSDWHGFD
uniref:adipose-secreted signaling protein n=1 Tax=Myxine glutinosa TaxID=7769 RepID=UPI00358E1C6F